MEDLSWYRFYTVGRGVLLGLFPVLELQLDVHIPITIQTRVLGTHYRERLANGADGVLHRAGANVLMAGAYVSTVVLVGKGSENRYGFFVQQEYWVEGHIGAEGGPNFPVGIGGDGY